MRRIAILPARGGSKRIPYKNIKNFCGKPMISYPIKALKKSNLFDEIHVSTDEKKIVDMVNKLGLKVDFYRPKGLSDDHTPLMPVIKYVIEKYKDMNKLFEEIWVIMPCSPLLTPEDLIKASISFKKVKSSSSLMAVTEYPVPIEWAFEVSKEGTLKPINKGNFAIRSQDLERRYYDAGMFYVYSQGYVLNADYNGSDENIFPYYVSRTNAIDIDDKDDWDYAEKLFKLKIK